MSTNYSSDIYSIAQYIEQIKSRYIEEPEDTLSMGIFGYLEEIHANIIQNSFSVRTGKSLFHLLFSNT